MAASIASVPPQRRSPLTLRNWHDPTRIPADSKPDRNAFLDCGWGRLLFAHTFASPEALVEELAKETPGTRDIAFYLRDPHVVVSLAPQTLFLDPSHAYRIWLDQYRPATPKNRQFTIRKIRPKREGPVVDAIYAARGMVPAGEDFWHRLKGICELTVLVAEDDETHEIIGAVFGVDHVSVFNDPENGSSMWALAVDARSPHSGIGQALTHHLAGHFLARGRAFMDLSVKHDKTDAIALYEKMSFQRVPVFTLKTKNVINTELFSGPAPDQDLNIYAKLIVDEARRRGIAVSVLDAAHGYFRLTNGAQSIVCRESLSALTSSVAMSICDNKAVTREVLGAVGLSMPDQVVLTDENGNLDAFLERYDRIVVKPARGEQGAGVAVDISTRKDALAAIRRAQEQCPTVLLEEFVEGEDLRVLVIGGEVVAAAIRRPAEIVGNGSDTARTVIEKQSRRREVATGGESSIPFDEETERSLRAAGYGLDDVPGQGEKIVLRKAANLHTGGTIHDVTDALNPALARAAVKAAAAIEIPVVGLDFLVPDVKRDTYWLIEANERPGLANHEPQPTAAKFIDLLFPLTVSRAPGQDGKEHTKK